MMLGIAGSCVCMWAMSIYAYHVGILMVGTNVSYVGIRLMVSCVSFV